MCEVDEGHGEVGGWMYGAPSRGCGGGERRDQGVNLVLLVANVAYIGCKARQISWWASIEVDAVWS
jgi:hypothetical protein